jgi:hypothetical protein
MAGWNVAQAQATSATSPTAGTWAVAGTGVTITFTNPQNAPVRFQVQGPAPASASTRWCATVTSGVPLTWASLTTNCWTGGSPQTPLAVGTPIQQAMIEVYGSNTKATPYDICIQDVTLQ